MILKQGIIGDNWCGFIFKPFSEGWTFKPSWGRWIVIPIDQMNYSSENKTWYLTTHTSSYYEVLKNNSVTITGVAIIILVRRADSGYIVEVSNDRVNFNRDDLYVADKGLIIEESISLLMEYAAISAYYDIDILASELNNPKPRFILNSKAYGLGKEEKSGIKTGQFIL